MLPLPTFWIINAACALLLAILLAGIMIPQILLISFRKNLFDEPDERKIHKLAVPRLGGMAFVPVILITLALLSGTDELIGYQQMFQQMTLNITTVAFSFCAMFILYIVGIADDLIGVKYRAKFVAQVICAVMLIAGGLAVDDFHGLLGLHGIYFIVAWLFTIVLAVFIVNSINLIDGIDGLASGLSSVAALVYGIIFGLAGEYLYMMLAAATMGVLVPFFYYNVFGNPLKQKKIFMGDTGSLSIGLILCILSFKMLDMKPNYALHNINLLIVAMSPLIVPCFDVVRVYFYRIRHGRNPFLPDKNHIHHKLLALGMTQRMALSTIVASSIIFTIANILLSNWVNVNIVLLIDVAVWTFIMLIIPRYIKRFRQKNGMVKGASPKVVEKVDDISAS